MTEQAGLARHSDGVLLFTPSLELNITRQFHGKIVYAFLFGEIRNIEKNASSLSYLFFLTYAGLPMGDFTIWGRH